MIFVKPFRIDSQEMDEVVEGGPQMVLEWKQIQKTVKTDNITVNRHLICSLGR